jgi:hypothetical protein
LLVFVLGQADLFADVEAPEKFLTFDRGSVAYDYTMATLSLLVDWADSAAVDSATVSLSEVTRWEFKDEKALNDSNSNDPVPFRFVNLRHPIGGSASTERPIMKANGSSQDVAFSFAHNNAAFIEVVVNATSAVPVSTTETEAVGHASIRFYLVLEGDRYRVVQDEGEFIRLIMPFMPEHMQRLCEREGACEFDVSVADIREEAF